MISTVVPVTSRFGPARLAAGLALVALAILTSAGAASAAAGVSSAPACQATTITAFAEADAWIAENSTANTGADAILIVEANPSSGNSRALVRFAMPDVPPHCIVESARLRLYIASGSDGARVEAVRLASEWSEGWVSWATQPEPTGPVAAAWSSDGYMRWNVTAQVRSIYDTGANDGFLIRDAAEGTEPGSQHDFHSKEKPENPPELVIRFAAPPTGGPRDEPDPPVAAAVFCGEVLTRSTLVTHDLIGCPGDGLVIGAPLIIVDLNGHTIDGSGLGSGIHNDGYPGVTVRNGTVQEFDYGVRLLPEASISVVERLTLRLNQLTAIELFDVADNHIHDNTIDESGNGIDLVNGTTRTTVARNTVTVPRETGLLLRDADGNWLEHNSILDGGGRGIWLDHASGNTVFGNAMISNNSDTGIELSRGSHGNLIESNRLNQDGDYGIHVSESEWNQLINNTAHLMSDSGIRLLMADNTVVRGNDVRFNPIGILVEGSGNLIEANNASESLGNGIELADSASGNHVVLNVANVNGGIGIYVEGDAGQIPGLGNLIERNTTSGNRVDGIFAEMGGHTITANVARNNAGWGISALGNIDGNGNVATGNGQSAQCLGIVCGSQSDPIETTITSGPAATTTDSSATFTFSASEAGLTFECALDLAAFAACTSPLQYTSLVPGAHQFQVRAVNPAGNVDATPASRSWTILPPDTTPPQTTIKARVKGSTITFTFAASEAGSTFECALDTAPFTSCTSPQVLSGLPAGAHQFFVRAIDPAGNVDPTPASHSWTIRR